MISVTNNVYKYIYNYPNMYTNDLADPTFKHFYWCLLNSRLGISNNKPVLHHPTFTSVCLGLETQSYIWNLTYIAVLFLGVWLSNCIAGCDGGRWANSDGRRVWRWGRASDHAARKHTIRRHQWPGRWRRLHKLAGARQQRSLEQQATHRTRQQAREYGLAALSVGDNMSNALWNHQGGALSLWPHFLPSMM